MIENKMQYVYSSWCAHYIIMNPRKESSSTVDSVDKKNGN